MGRRADYLFYVRMLTSFRSAIEGRIATGRDRFRPTLISEILAKDCEDIGLGRVDPVLPSEIDCRGDAWLGIVYVLEGSTLGAPMLFRSAARFGYDECHGARHLARQIAARANWKKFLGYLDGLPSVDMALAARAANATFDLALDAARQVGCSIELMDAR
jgi:heme oxygenase